MNSSVIASIAFLLLSSGLQAHLGVNSTLSSAEPIHVEVCRATITTRIRTLQLRFVNVSSITAGAVVFNIQVGSRRSEVRDVGQFSTNAQIDHTFRLDIDPWAPFGSRPTQSKCTVRHVDFITVDRYSQRINSP